MTITLTRKTVQVGDRTETRFKSITQIDLAEPMSAGDARTVMAHRTGKFTYAFVILGHINPDTNEAVLTDCEELITCDGIRSFNAVTHQLALAHKEVYGVMGIVYSVYFPNLV